MTINDFEELRRIVVHTSTAAKKDAAVFKQWEENYITVYSAIDKFKKNNYIDNDVNINKYIFIRYMNFCGYWRKYTWTYY